MSSGLKNYAVVVVGAGPAGLAVVGNLLEQQVRRILWVDTHFQGGRVNRAYREVPSNTKASLFVSFVEAVKPFRDVIQAKPGPNAISDLKKLEGEKGCLLKHAADACLMLSKGIGESPDVDTQLGRVKSANWENESLKWIVQIQDPASNPIKVSSPRLVLCTGSSPVEHPLPVPNLNIQRIHLDTALTPSVLVSSIPTNNPVTVAVIGASHSAVLILHNLFNLATSTHPQLRIKWFFRNPLEYAEYMDGWILRDNTGLKGLAADWARENLEEDKFSSSPVSKYIQKIDSKIDEKALYERHLPLCTHLVQAIGFKRDPIPTMYSDGKELNVVYNPTTGGFANNKGKKVPGLYGAGIAWPELVVDPMGNVEYAIGFWKFMKYLKRVVTNWVSE
ncbi:MAG: hypothetical protein M1834_002556 [Cirrosporium novae-zelandiae]|nr:MAG: hypothetical protein M1834_002556 [Cirrosporium novae-zelandiae]